MAVGGWDPQAATKLLDQFEVDVAAAAGAGTGSIFRSSIMLYRQCIRAYVAKAVDLSAMGCRATLENGAFALLTHRRNGPTSHEIVPFGEPDRSAMFSPEEWEPLVPLGKMIRALGDRGAIDPGQVSSAFAIKVHGDGVAHFEAKSVRTTYTELAKPHSAPWVAPPTAADDAGVLADLKATGEILISMIKWDLEQGRLAGLRAKVGP